MINLPVVIIFSRVFNVKFGLLRRAVNSMWFKIRIAYYSLTN